MFIDLSHNMFEGSIPEEMGDFKSLYGFNASYNSLIGLMPSSLGKMKQMKWLDLSMNRLSDTISLQLENLNFLEVFNLSHNHFVGIISTAPQSQLFPVASFEGNDGLCRPSFKDYLNTIHQPKIDP